MMHREASMKAITLRNVPPDVEKVVRRRAVEKNLSLNKAVIELVALGGGLTKPAKELHSDLDDLFGRWTKREADAFDRRLRGLRKVDAELWR
jgi:hypothetical protein